MTEFKEPEVSFTARVMAANRAVEARRPDALFIDPFAEQLAGTEAIDKAIPILENYEKQGKPYTSVRTRFFDDFLVSCSENIRQIVLIGAGMDTRAFRLNWQPGTHIYEIDQPDILHYKDSVLNAVSPSGIRHSISTDLREQHLSRLLLEQGYQTSELTLWLLEGFLYYLNEAEVNNLMTTINNLSIAGSWLGADVINTVIKNGSEEWAKYWHSSCDAPESFFAAYGWKASVLQPGEEGASFGRFTYQFPDRSIPDTPHIFLVTACKED